MYEALHRFTGTIVEET